MVLTVKMLKGDYQKAKEISTHNSASYFFGTKGK